MAIIESLHFEEADIAEFCSVHGCTSNQDATISTEQKYRGSKSLKLQNASSGTLSYISKLVDPRWTGHVYGRFLFYMNDWSSTYPDNVWLYLMSLPMTNEMSFTMRVTLDRKLNAGMTTAPSTSSVTIPIGIWTEIMFHVAMNPLTYDIEIKLLGETLSSQEIAYGADSIYMCQIGNYSGYVDSLLYIDEFEFNDSEYPPSLMDTNNYTISTLNNVSLTNFKVV